MMAVAPILRGEPLVAVPLHLVLSGNLAEQTDLAPALQLLPNLTK
jgi:hypothetical protein